MKISTSIGVMLLAGAAVSPAQAQTKSEDFINPPPPRTIVQPPGATAPAPEGSGFEEPVRPSGRGANDLVYRGGSWFVVRSVRDGGKTVTCTGMYRINRNVQVNKDGLVFRTPVHINTISLGYDDQAMGAARAPTAAEREAGAVTIAGSDFAQLTKRGRLKIDVVTNDGAKTRHDLDLQGLAGAVKNIEAGCPGRR